MPVENCHMRETPLHGCVRAPCGKLSRVTHSAALAVATGLVPDASPTLAVRGAPLVVWGLSSCWMARDSGVSGQITIAVISVAGRRWFIPTSTRDDGVPCMSGTQQSVYDCVDWRCAVHSSSSVATPRKQHQLAMWTSSSWRPGSLCCDLGL